MQHNEALWDVFFFFFFSMQRSWRVTQHRADPSPFWLTKDMVLWKMSEGMQACVWHRCQGTEALSRAASYLVRQFACLITLCGSHLAQASEFTCFGQGQSMYLILWPTFGPDGNKQQQQIYKDTRKQFVVPKQRKLKQKKSLNLKFVSYKISKQNEISKKEQSTV